jgi:peroxiredoxin
MAIALASVIGAARSDAQAAGPAVGDIAPDFSLPAATREGVSTTPVSLSSLKGQTVVLAFFYKARTKG